MDQLTHYLAMGGYGGFVWPAYGLAALVLIGLFVASRRFLAAGEAELAALEAEAGALPHRRAVAGERLSHEA